MEPSRITRYGLLVFLCGLLMLVPASPACDISWCPQGDGEGHEDELLVEIGTFDSKDIGMRAAIKRLASETARCRETKTFRIMWIGPSDENEGEMRNAGGGRALLYYGKESAKWLGYEHDFLSGTSGRNYLVDRDAIQAVAARG